MTDRNRPTHTPGPWQASMSIIDGKERFNGSICAGCEVIAEDVSAANARLVAAAPETAAERDELRAKVARLEARGIEDMQHELAQEQKLTARLQAENMRLVNEWERVTAERDALLEAARDAKWELEDYQEWLGEGACVSSGAGPCIEALRAAIAKAERSTS